MFNSIVLPCAGSIKNALAERAEALRGQRNALAGQAQLFACPNSWIKGPPTFPWIPSTLSATPRQALL